MQGFSNSIKLFVSLHKKELKLIGISFFVGALWVVALRFVTLRSNAVHYHANFALYVKGERVTLDSPLYYEEVQACGGEAVDNPKIRTHLHNQVNDVVHVHDNGVTWGHFFANIGMTNGDKVFRIDNTVYIDSEKMPITFILNGEKVESSANVLIKSEDKLLVSIGTTEELKLQEQYASISDSAGDYNGKYDPSGCSGGKDFTFVERLKKSFGVFGD